MPRFRNSPLIFAFLFGTALLADMPKQLIELRRKFESLHHQTEVDRVRYITELARLRETFTRAEYKKMDAIDNEVIKHPMPPNVDASVLRKRIVGRWTSPRHTYLYRDDGTWTLLPEVVDGVKTTRGTWRVESNKFFQDFAGEPPDRGETLIIVTDT